VPLAKRLQFQLHLNLNEERIGGNLLPRDATAQAMGNLTLADISVPFVSDIAGDVLVTNDAPEAGFPVGETTVTWVATDDSGNSTSDTQTVTLTPPNPAGR
jgi:hypothetical protein